MTTLNLIFKTEMSQSEIIQQLKTHNANDTLEYDFLEFYNKTAKDGTWDKDDILLGVRGSQDRHLDVYKRQVDDPELIELVEMEVTEQLEEYGFNDCPIIQGSALKLSLIHIYLTELTR